MFSLNRRSFLKGLAYLGGIFGVAKAEPAKAIPVDLKPSHLVRLRFKPDGDYLELLNGPEVMQGIALKKVDNGLHPSFEGVDFKWGRESRAWIDKKDAQLLIWKKDQLVVDKLPTWGEVIITEAVGYSATRYSAHVSFWLKPCDNSQSIQFPQAWAFSKSSTEIRQEVEKAFADTLDPRPGVEIKEFIPVAPWPYDYGLH